MDRWTEQCKKHGQDDTRSKFQKQKDLACQREGLWIGQTELETEISGIYKHDTSCLLQMEWGIKNQSI